MIALLAILSYSSYERISRVNSELTDITAYLVPIGDAINTAGLHALEQEIHLEHLERLCEAGGERIDVLLGFRQWIVAGQPPLCDGDGWPSSISVRHFFPQMEYLTAMTHAIGR